MVMHPSRVSGRKIIVWLAVGLSFFGLLVVDRLIYFRKISWPAPTMKGITAVYFGCENRNEFKEAVTGDWLIQIRDSKLADKVTDDFTGHAKEITVFPNGCFYKSVIAWGPELHYWAEEWMPFAPRPGRYVLFDDKTRKFVPADEFASFGCPK
jgi:hypothetical protein